MGLMEWLGLKKCADPVEESYKAWRRERDSWRRGLVEETRRLIQEAVGGFSKELTAMASERPLRRVSRVVTDGRGMLFSIDVFEDGKAVVSAGSLASVSFEGGEAVFFVEGVENCGGVQGWLSLVLGFRNRRDDDRLERLHGLMGLVVSRGDWILGQC